MSLRQARIFVLWIEPCGTSIADLGVLIQIPQPFEDCISFQEHVRVEDQVIVGRHGFKSAILARTVAHVAVSLYDAQTNVLGGAYADLLYRAFDRSNVLLARVVNNHREVGDHGVFGARAAMRI